MKKLRILDKTNLIFHLGQKIYSYFDIKSDDFRNLWIKSKRVLHISNSEEKQILLRFMGEFIAKILIDEHGNWRVNSQGSVYEAIYPDNLENIEEILLCPAFDYEPFIFKDGMIAFSISPKSRLFMNYSLRDKDDILKELFEKGIYLIDYCPKVNCSEKRDPYTTCRLSTPVSIGHKMY